MDTQLTGSYGQLATFGRSASATDRAAILTALRGYLSAIATGEWSQACGQLAAPIRHQLELLLAHAKGAGGRGCSAALGRLLGHVPAPLRRRQAPLSVVAVRVEGRRAIVLYRSALLPHSSISMFREGGGWKAGVLAGSDAA
jgi:hypothetical protein